MSLRWICTSTTYQPRQSTILCLDWSKMASRRRLNSSDTSSSSMLKSTTISFKPPSSGPDREDDGIGSDQEDGDRTALPRENQRSSKRRRVALACNACRTRKSRVSTERFSHSLLAHEKNLTLFPVQRFSTQVCHVWHIRIWLRLWSIWLKYQYYCAERVRLSRFSFLSDD